MAAPFRQDWGPDLLVMNRLWLGAANDYAHGWLTTRQRPERADVSTPRQRNIRVLASFDDVVVRISDDHWENPSPLPVLDRQAARRARHRRPAPGAWDAAPPRAG